MAVQVNGRAFIPAEQVALAGNSSTAVRTANSIQHALRELNEALARQGDLLEQHMAGAGVPPPALPSWRCVLTGHGVDLEEEATGFRIALVP